MTVKSAGVKVPRVNACIEDVYKDPHTYIMDCFFLTKLKEWGAKRMTRWPYWFNQMGQWTKIVAKIKMIIE